MARELLLNLTNHSRGTARTLPPLNSSFGVGLIIMKLIISGVPCCGKTYFGDWLRDNHGFTHVNLEDRSLYLQQIIMTTIEQGFPCWVSTISENIVVTWGFSPNEDCCRIIRLFKSSGFEAWWFTSDYQLARNRYVDKYGENQTVQFFDPQIQRLQAATRTLEELYGVRHIETLCNEGYLAPNIIFDRLRTYKS
jgi:hypothetical protein